MYVYYVIVGHYSGQLSTYIVPMPDQNTAVGT